MWHVAGLWFRYLSTFVDVMYNSESLSRGIAYAEPILKRQCLFYLCSPTTTTLCHHGPVCVTAISAKDNDINEAFPRLGKCCQKLQRSLFQWKWRGNKLNKNNTIIVMARMRMMKWLVQEGWKWGDQGWGVQGEEGTMIRKMSSNDIF